MSNTAGVQAEANKRIGTFESRRIQGTRSRAARAGAACVRSRRPTCLFEELKGKLWLVCILVLVV